MSAAENKRVLEQIFSGMPTDNGETFVDLLAEDVCWIITGQTSWSQTFHGKSSVLNDLQAYVGSLMEGRIKAKAYNFIAEGDTVVVESKGDNITKTGLRYDNDYCMVIRMENGKIKSIKEYLDSLLVEKVLGPWPQPAA